VADGYGGGGEAGKMTMVEEEGARVDGEEEGARGGG